VSVCSSVCHSPVAQPATCLLRATRVARVKQLPVDGLRLFATLHICTSEMFGKCYLTADDLVISDVFEILGFNSIGVTTLTFQSHMTSSVTCYLTFPVGHFLSLVVLNQSSISDGFRDIQWRMWSNGWRDFKTTSKQRSRSFWY